MGKFSRETTKDQLKLYIFILPALAYVFATMQRVATAIFAADIIKELSISETKLTLLVSVTFYVQAMLQPVAGFFADKIGPRKTITYFTTVGALGTIIFALAPNYPIMFVGRILTGVGIGIILIPMFKIIGSHFPRAMFSRLAGINFAFGGLGMIIAGAPLAYLSRFIYWRVIYLIIAGFVLLLAILIYIFIPEQELNGPAKSDALLKDKLRDIVRNGNFWRCVIIMFSIQGSTFAVTSLWGGIMLAEKYGIDKVSIGQYLSIIPIGALFGNLFIGFFSEKIVYSRKIPMFLDIPLFLTGFALIFFFKIPLWLLYPVFFVYGFTNSFGPIIFAIIRESFKPQIGSTALGLVNVAPFMGMVVWQVIPGVVRDSGTQGFILPFLPAFIAIAAALISALTLRETMLKKEK